MQTFRTSFTRSSHQPFRLTSTTTTTTSSSPTSSSTLAATNGAKIQGYSSEHRPCGLLARKLGMMSLWDANNVRHGVTVLCVDRCHVLRLDAPNPNDLHRKWKVQVGAGPKRPYGSAKPWRYHCAKAGVEPKQHAVEFTVHELFKLAPGTELRASIFAPGEHVDVTGTSIGKGTQGVMKRWGFKGGPASHGCSKAHRKAGSIGMSTKPGRVFKGKKMAGRMGNKRVTVRKLMVYRVDAVRNLIYVKGCVPGNSGGWVRVRESVMCIDHNGPAPKPLRESTKGVLEWKKDGVVEHIDPIHAAHYQEEEEEGSEEEDLEVGQIVTESSNV